MTVRQATAHSVERNGGSAVRRSDAGHPFTSRPMRRDNRNMIQRKAGEMTIYQLTDRLHDGRTVRVQADHIAPTVASWLAELGA